jgi:hypothetical protein
MEVREARRFDDVEDCVEAVLSKVGRRIALCTPIGAGKPVALVNAFYGRAVADPRIELSILTGLTLARPRPGSELERRLVEPITAKVYGDAPEPQWTGPLRAGRLPANVRVQEFFMEPGAWLGVPGAQQAYASINYTHVARSVLAEGANVIAQQVALRPGGRTSLGTNPDVTADLIPMLRERERAGTPVAVVGQANACRSCSARRSCRQTPSTSWSTTRAAITTSSRRPTCPSRPPSTRSPSPQVS